MSEKRIILVYSLRRKGTIVLGNSQLQDFEVVCHMASIIRRTNECYQCKQCNPSAHFLYYYPVQYLSKGMLPSTMVRCSQVKYNNQENSPQTCSEAELTFQLTLDLVKLAISIHHHIGYGYICQVICLHISDTLHTLPKVKYVTCPRLLSVKFCLRNHYSSRRVLNSHNSMCKNHSNIGKKWQSLDLSEHCF